MKKTRSKIIIKTRKGGYTKLYANGKWQHKVTNLDFHADMNGHKLPYINIECEFDTYMHGEHGLPIISNGEIVKKHHVIKI